MSQLPPPMPYPGQYPSYGPAPDNYLVWAILTTLFCCLPLGIVSIVKSASVNGLWMAGDHAGAYKAAADAKNFAVWSAVAGGVGIALYLLVVVGGTISTTTY